MWPRCDANMYKVFVPVTWQLAGGALATSIQAGMGACMAPLCIVLEMMKLCCLTFGAA